MGSEQANGGHIRGGWTDERMGGKREADGQMGRGWTNGLKRADRVWTR